MRLMQKTPRLRVLLNSLLLSIPSLANVGALLFLLFFVYAVLGNQLFALVRLQGELNAVNNFQVSISLPVLLYL